MGIKRENTLHLEGKAIQRVVYIEDSVHVAAGQPSDESPNIRGRDREWIISLRAGRRGSTDVADSFNTVSGNPSHTYSPASRGDVAPGRLNFFFGVTLTLETARGTTATDVWLGHGQNALRRNNWWIGGDAVMNMNNRSPMLEVVVGGTIQRFSLSGGVSTITLTPLS